MVRVACTARLVVNCNSAAGSGSRFAVVEADEVVEMQAAEVEDVQSVRSSEAAFALL